MFYAQNQYANESFPLLNNDYTPVTSKEEAERLVAELGNDYVLTTGWQTKKIYPFEEVLELAESYGHPVDPWSGEYY